MPEETTFERLKRGLLELLRGYPIYRFFGKIEYYLQNSQSSLKVLKQDGIIEFASKKEAKELNKKLTPEQLAQLKEEGKKEPPWYRLAPKGIDLAVSLINADYSKKVLKYTQETQEFNRRIIKLTNILVIIGTMALIVGIIQILPEIISAFKELF